MPKIFEWTQKLNFFLPVGYRMTGEMNSNISYKQLTSNQIRYIQVWRFSSTPCSSFGACYWWSSRRIDRKRNCWKQYRLIMKWNTQISRYRCTDICVSGKSFLKENAVTADYSPIYMAYGLLSLGRGPLFFYLIFF